MAGWKDITVPPEMPLANVIAKIDMSGLQVALILAADDSLLGILTDGDIRRAILAGKSLRVPVSELMTQQPIAMLASTPRHEMRALMRKKAINHLPLVDDAGLAVGLETFDNLVGAAEHPNWVVLMAGGLGTRLQPLTYDCPKPLLKVGNKPILETILENFADQNFKRIFIALNYKSEMIRNYFGLGDRWGLQVEYLQENTRLGTAGALSLLPEKPTSSVLVMNADLLSHINFNNLLKFHDEAGSAATMAVREHNYQLPYGTVHFNGIRIESIEEKPVQKHYVNAGIYVLSPEALKYLPTGKFCDMPTLFEQLIIADKITTAYLHREYWLDIGRLEEYEQAQRDFASPPVNQTFQK